jgi:hypothetical protein
MPVSRRLFLADASALGMITALLPQLAAAQNAAAQNSTAAQKPPLPRQQLRRKTCLTIPTASGTGSTTP